MESDVISEGDVNDITNELGEATNVNEITCGTEHCNTDDIAVSTNKFCVDYSIRGTAKCKICKNNIPKGELRMGVYIYFKDKMITNYRHVPCAFGKMQKARVESNVIKSPNEIDGLEKLSAVDQQIIINRIQEDKEKRSAPLARSYQKIIVPRNVLSPIERRKKLKMMKTPSIKVLFTNADQFTHSKKNELQERIITDKPIIIAVSEVKPKNSKDMTEAD